MTKNKDVEKASDIPAPANIAEIIKKGNDIYETLKTKLEADYSGKYVVIELDSRKYFIGETRGEATEKAREIFPDTIMFVRRIGQIEKASRHMSRHHSSYARLF